jgi:hypothetical protein
MDQQGTVQQVTAEIQQDWEVFGSDGQKIGNVNEVHTNYIWVQKGLLFPTDMYIPVTALARTEQGCVHLSMTATEVIAAGWHTLPETITANAPLPGTVPPPEVEAAK